MRARPQLQLLLLAAAARAQQWTHVSLAADPRLPQKMISTNSPFDSFLTGMVLSHMRMITASMCQHGDARASKKGCVSAAADMQVLCTQTAYITVVLSFLRNERERFPLIVSIGNCVPVQTFPTVQRS
jgi:hypothetical protein